MNGIERTMWGAALAAGLLGLSLSAGAQPAPPPEPCAPKNCGINPQFRWDKVLCKCVDTGSHPPPLPLVTTTVNVRVTKKVMCIKAPCPPIGVSGASVAEKHTGAIGTGTSSKTTDKDGYAKFSFKTLGKYVGSATFSTQGAAAKTVKIPKSGSLSLELLKSK